MYSLASPRFPSIEADDANVAHASAADHLGRGATQVILPSADKGAAVIDAHCHTATMAQSDTRPKWKRSVRGRHRTAGKVFSARCLVSAPVAGCVPRCDFGFSRCRRE